MGVAGVMIAAPAVVAAPALAAVGFGANGIAAGQYPALYLSSTFANRTEGSTAAGVHAGIGNLVAHGGFATLQSAGMAGYGAPIVHGIVQAAGAAVGAGTAYSKAKEGTKCDQRKPSEGGNNLKGSKRDSKL